MALFLYLSQLKEQKITWYCIDPHTGDLTSIGQFPTEHNPRSFHFDPQGCFLYAAGESSDRLVAYHIDAKSGALEPMHTYETGHVPW
jgi:6-phosphogluconolactonase